jgi:hypothetical protein
MAGQILALRFLRADYKPSRNRHPKHVCQKKAVHEKTLPDYQPSAKQDLIYKLLAFSVGRCHIPLVSSTAIKHDKLRPEIIQMIDKMDDQSLQLLHRILLLVEKDRLWRELSEEAERDRLSGKFERLPELIREARAELHKG